MPIPPVSIRSQGFSWRSSGWSTRSRVVPARPSVIEISRFSSALNKPFALGGRSQRPQPVFNRTFAHAAGFDAVQEVVELSAPVLLQWIETQRFALAAALQGSLTCSQLDLECAFRAGDQDCRARQ